MDGPTTGPTNGLTNRVAYRVACMQQTRPIAISRVPFLKTEKYSLIQPKRMNSFPICLKICKKITFIDVKDLWTNGLIDQPIYHHILYALYIIY